MRISLLKIIFSLVFFLSPFVVFAGTEHNMSGWAWSSNIGWISFNSTNCDTDGNGHIDVNCGGNNSTGSVVNYGVNKDVTTGNLTGYAWSSNIGWIQFGGLSGWPAATTGNGTTASNAKVDLTTGAMSGWARALSNGGGWDGWISLKGKTTAGTTYGVTLTSTGSTLASQYDCKTDCVWGSDVVGWIDFSGVIFGAPAAISIGVNLIADPSVSSVPGTTSLSWVTTGSPDSCTATGGSSGWTTTPATPVLAPLKAPGGGSQDISGLSVGTYTYTITCAKAGATNVASTAIFQVGTTGPTADAGPDKIITYPTSTSTSPTGAYAKNFDGTPITVPPNGTIAWVKISGPDTFTITDGTTISPTFSGLIPGTYIFQLTATNSGGETAFSQMTVIVSRDGACSIPPALPTHYNCVAGTSSNPQSSPSKWTWTCVGSLGGVPASCSQNNQPGFIEN